MPKQWILTTLYIIFIYAIIHGAIIYARNHPYEDQRPPPKTMLDSATKPQ